MIRIISHLCARVASLWRATDPQQPLPEPKPTILRDTDGDIIGEVSAQNQQRLSNGEVIDVNGYLVVQIDRTPHAPHTQKRKQPHEEEGPGCELPHDFDTLDAIMQPAWRDGRIAMFAEMERRKAEQERQWRKEQEHRAWWRTLKPEQVAPKSFDVDEDDCDSHVAFHRYSDGIPVAIARAYSFINPPAGCYTAPLANGDVSLYRCTLPELQTTP